MMNQGYPQQGNMMNQGYPQQGNMNQAIQDNMMNQGLWSKHDAGKHWRFMGMQLWCQKYRYLCEYCGAPKP